MNPTIGLIRDWAASWGVPAALVPLVPFLLLLIVLYAVIGLAAYGAQRRWPRADKTIAFWLFVSPWLIGFCLFTVGPMASSVYVSLTSWDLITPPQFVGLANYSEAFQDPQVGQALKVTLLYAVISVPLQTALAFLVALLLNSELWGMRFFRTIWYLPSLVSGVAQMVLFLWVFNPQYGLANDVLAHFGIQGPGWFNDSSWALPTVILMSLWTVGGAMVIYLAGLKDVPTNLYEAAALDGAGPVRQFWHVTLPQLSPIILFNVLTGIIGSLQIFTQGFIAKGGPKDSLLFFVYYLYDNAFQNFRMGYASALAWILFVVILALTAVTLRGSAFAVYYETEMTRKRRRR
ncbi:carbohydrate ABC transporter permease [Kribbella kalugense]|uniref:Carbohydrate ABC transporter membrane protein 1 (CUT1 family) n=1 Tax=Kribbella kalugense TaxID=2512221 RepID=A0A4R7ZZS3_9ACTN|nr:sugar ABC transporter permease [Kribbella kalugense]TDW23375.1 carbohydrate ABC transporter membrane protein 1 (CUT1 family) [Kribbella kalugense]